MSGLQSRGYLLTTTAGFLRSKVGESDYKNILAKLSPELQQLLGGAVKPAVWYPIALLNELNRSIAATLRRRNDDLARDAFYNAGKLAAREATNSFLRMFLRILTPALFAKKLPEVFRRDFSGGKLVVEVEDRSLVCEMSELPGFEH